MSVGQAGGIRGALEKFVNHGLVRFFVTAGEAAKAREEARIDADRNKLFRVG